MSDLEVPPNRMRDEQHCHLAAQHQYEAPKYQDEHVGAYRARMAAFEPSGSQ
ncbi:MAG TPA: hypothetical protein VMQ45_01435 [Burkholderiaceae bacterium]|nr:hypothetical protein [Burkholderiaceae bacterium]